MSSNEYCITTVVVGDKYRKMLDVYMESYNRFDNMPQMLVVTESPDCINHDNIIVTNIGDNPIKVNNDFNMCLKRLAFQHAIDTGYEKLIFIDIDRIIETWDWNTIHNTTKPGFGTNWLRYTRHTKGVVRPRDVKSCKYETILSGMGDDAYDCSYPVFGESLNIVSLKRDKIQQFVDIWSECGDAIKQSRCSPRHINVEMGIALKRSNIDIYKYDPPIDTDFKGEIFKHYCYGKKKQMLEKLNK